MGALAGPHPGLRQRGCGAVRGGVLQPQAHGDLAGHALHALVVLAGGGEHCRAHRLHADTAPVGIGLQKLRMRRQIVRQRPFVPAVSGGGRLVLSLVMFAWMQS